MKEKHRSLLKLFDPFPADQVVQTLREVVSDTFSEMHNEEQYGEALQRIRDRIWSILPPFNELLEEIEIEPIAERRLHEEFEDENPSEVNPSGKENHEDEEG